MDVARPALMLQRGNLSSLAAALQRSMPAYDHAQLHPCPARMYGALCETSSCPVVGSCKDRLAVLIAGLPRSMILPDVTNAYAELMRVATSLGWKTHVFAHVNYGRTLGLDAKAKGLPPVSAGMVHAALRAWHVPYTLERADSDPSVRFRQQSSVVNFSTDRCGRGQGCWPGVPSESLVVQHHMCTDQFGSGIPRTSCTREIYVSPALRKLAAATDMMLRNERQLGVRYDIVLSARPDLCMRPAMRVLSTALAHASRCSPMVLTWHDGMALVPRWAAEVYGAPWRPVVCEGTSRSAPLQPLNVSRLSSRLASRLASRLWSFMGGANVPSRLGALGISGSELIDFMCAGTAHSSLRRELVVCRERLAVRRPFSSREGFEFRTMSTQAADGSRRYRHEKVEVIGHCPHFA